MYTYILWKSTLKFDRTIIAKYDGIFSLVCEYDIKSVQQNVENFIYQGRSERRKVKVRKSQCVKKWRTRLRTTIAKEMQQCLTCNVAKSTVPALT